MEESYEEIVRKWYLKMRGSFTSLIMDRYKDSNLRLGDVENIYQDVFIAIHENIQKGKIKSDTNWESYILRVGLNLASKKNRRLKRHDSIDAPDEEEADKLSSKAKKISDLLNSLPSENEELADNDEITEALGDQLTHTPEPCASIIRLTYYGNMTDSEIAEVIPDYRDNGKPLATNAKAVKARRWLCMRDLIYRVKLSLYHAGIIDEKPIKQKRNG